MVLRTMPLMLGEHGYIYMPARDAVFTGQIQGVEQMLVQNDLRQVTGAQKFPIGSLLWNPTDDAKFRYVEFGGTIASGFLAQAEAPDAAHDDLNSNGTGTGASQAIGSTLISLSDTITLVVNEYAGGKLALEIGTGGGHHYPIKSHDAPADNSLFILEEPGLAVAISGATVTLVKSRYKEVIINPTDSTADIVGVSLGVGADGSFGWVQTRGVAMVSTDGTVVVGDHVRASDGTAGEVEPLDRDGTAEDEVEVGRVVNVGPDNEFSLIYLTLE